jgi:hypothetical protein
MRRFESLARADCDVHGTADDVDEQRVGMAVPIMSGEVHRSLCLGLGASAKIMSCWSCDDVAFVVDEPMKFG